MKIIALHNSDKVKAKDILLIIARSPEPGKGINYEEMQTRLRLIDTIEALEDNDVVIEFEDNDYNALTRLARAYPFGVADRDLLTILEDVLNAKTPPKPKLVKSSESDG